MVLVAYSDSEGSSSEERPKPAVKAAPKLPQSQTAAGFAVNKSNPRKIQVSLVGSNAATSSRSDDGEPAPKRARVGGGGLGGFNAMLPAPKRENEKKPTSNGATRRVFSLKTGAEPGFSREADAELRQLFAVQTPTSEEKENSNSVQRHGGDIFEQPQQNGTGITNTSAFAGPEPVNMGNSLRFRPLSVARNTNKKKSAGSVPAKKAAGPMFSDTPVSTGATVPAPKAPKVNLFSAGVDPLAASNTASADATLDDTGQETQDTDGAFEIPTENINGNTMAAPPSQSQSLDTIASDLNLSAADRRRLFGREGKGTNSAINIVNFNTDQEYAANEALRSSGEQVKHNPVRGIAPGKHSLKQLVNAASTQKDALEESFAAGKSNKREAGSRYGW
jgi:Mitotic checkpoint regulator, MAD2B-interacting